MKRRQIVISQKLVSGVCVACSRRPGRVYRCCPYCGERVWWPRWRTTLDYILPLGSVLLAVMALYRAELEWQKLVRAWQTASPLASVFFAAAWGLLLLPVPDGDLIFSTKAEQIRWQVLSLGAGLFCGATAMSVAVALFFSKDANVTLWLISVMALLCAAGMMVVFRVPLRTIPSVLLLVIAVSG